MKVYPDPYLLAVVPIDAADVAAEQTRFDQGTSRRSEILRSAQEASSAQQRHQFIKKIDGLSAKLLEQT